LINTNQDYDPGTQPNKQFDKFRASELYCPKCKKAQPVREKVLLILPHSTLYEYKCTVCGESLGTREA
jgi:predicted RNA-binding Zn-ribbon protein involved in translation (DUF1610 family)